MLYIRHQLGKLKDKNHETSMGRSYKDTEFTAYIHKCHPLIIREAINRIKHLEKIILEESYRLSKIRGYLFSLIFIPNSRIQPIGCCP